MNRTFFDEALAFDVRHAFLNPAEFGVPMNVDGLDTVGIWDDAANSDDVHATNSAPKKPPAPKKPSRARLVTPLRSL